MLCIYVQAISIDDEPMKFIGIIPMLDPPREDTKETIGQLKQLGIRIKMITGNVVGSGR